ncbi:Hpt domain-containing protein [Jannaschia faecimaris]|uniref:Hpt domain-containing protein n=1 Tax=Jannaschia faecimaris TaxID=1244108 RepID=A0A1H3IS18_9RHOB|nr:Hpt domain-containing protein [Jannaschia faecimaris]SDY30530.1 Hpt domain-containing protein [Jannaschia faecimaris]
MIDRSRIEELQQEIGTDDLSFIVSVYLDEARTTLDQMAQGLSAEDYARAAHFLRSGALNIGLSGIAVLAAQMVSEIAANLYIAQPISAVRLGEVLDQTMAELEAISAVA